MSDNLLVYVSKIAPPEEEYYMSKHVVDFKLNIEAENVMLKALKIKYNLLTI
jgi:hypothetical protein